MPSATGPQTSHAAAEQQRLAKLDEPSEVLRHAFDERQLSPMKSAGTATRNPAIGPAIPMSKSAIFDGNARPDADERAERAGQRQRRGQEKRQRGVDAVERHAT